MKRYEILREYPVSKGGTDHEGIYRKEDIQWNCHWKA